MEIILGVAAALLAVISVTVIIRSMELTSTNKQLADRNTGIQRDLKKLQGQLDNQASKYQAKAQEVAKTGTKTKGQKQRISRLSDELQGERSELKKARSRVQELSGDLNRLRIDREKLREELAGLKERQDDPRVAAKPVAVEETAEEVAVSADTPAAESVEAPTPSKKNSFRLERDLERAEEFISHLKRRLVETTADMRAAQRRNEHNRRAYIITQLQLDLLVDENYVLKHGTPPPFSQAEKQQKRAAMRPEEERIVVDRDSAPIELPDVDELEAQAEEALRLAREEAEIAVAAEMAAAEEAAAEAAAAEEAAEEAAEAAAAEAAAAEEAATEEVAATEEAAAAEAAAEEVVVEKKKGTVRRRKSKASAATTAEAG